MKKLILPLLISGATFQAAATETLQVHGISVQAEKIGYFVGSKQVHSFRLTQPTVFPFENGNTLIASGDVYLYASGTISAIVSSENNGIEWKTGSQTTKMNCGARFDKDVGQNRDRVVSFHENKAYKSGCSASGDLEVKTSEGGQVFVNGDLEFASNGQLTFAEKVSGGQLRIGSHDVKLVSGTALGFHPSGKPEFFTPQAGQMFSTEVSGYGKMIFTQKSGTPTATFMTAEGSVERGVLAMARQHAQLGILIPGGSGVMFQSVGGEMVLTGMVFGEPVVLHAKGGYQIQTAKLVWELDTGLFRLVPSQEFLFQDPENKDNQLMVKPGWLVFLSPQWKIIAIQTPQPQ